MDVLEHPTGEVPCRCVLREDGSVAVVGAAGCPVHGMHALRIEVASLRRQNYAAVEDRDKLAAYLRWRFTPQSDAPMTLSEITAMLERLGGDSA